MTDISVQIVDSSKDLAGVPFSKSSEESDPLAIHDDVRNDGVSVTEAGDEDKVSCDEHAKEDCTPERQNGNKTSVLVEKSDDTNEETLVTQESNEAPNEVETAEACNLDANAPTPDLPDQFSETTPKDDFEATEIETAEIQTNNCEISDKAKPEVIDEIEAKLNEFDDDETPMQIDINISSELLKSEEALIPEKDLVEDQIPEEDFVEENITELETAEPSQAHDNDVDMIDIKPSESVEEKVSKIIEYTLSEEIETTSENTSTKETYVDPEKNLTATENPEAVLEKTKKFIEKTEIKPEITDLVIEKIEKAENTAFILDKTEIISQKTKTESLNVNELVLEKSEIESLDTTKIVSSKSKPYLETTVTVPETTKTVEKTVPETTKTVENYTETVSEKVAIPNTSKVPLKKPKIVAEKPTVSKILNEAVKEKADIQENLQTALEKPEKMDVDSEKMDVVSDKIRVRSFDVSETKTSKNVQPVNGDVSKDEQPTKRRASDDIEESPLKKLCQEVEKNFPHHDAMINEYIQCTTKNNIDEIQKHTEHLLAEIQTLRELAQKKEQEWNNILHLKKVKEEILLRLLRRKQVLSFEKSLELNGSTTDHSDPFDYLNQSKNLAIDKSDEISGLSIKQPGSSSVLRQSVSPINPIQSLQNAMAPVMPVPSHFNPMSGLPPPYDKAAAAHMQSMSNNLQNMTNSMQSMSNNMQNMSNTMPNMSNSMPNMSNSMQNLQNMSKQVYQPMMMPGPLPGFPRDINAMNGQMASNYGMPMGRQGPTKDVKSIIADYRQRNPDITPRRGRRMKSILNPNMMNAPRNIAPKELNNLNNLNMLFNNMDMNQKAMLERLQQLQAGGLPNSIFKDALVQFASMQQANAGLMHSTRPVEPPARPEHHPKERRRVERQQAEEPPKAAERPPSAPRLPPPPYPEISLLPVSSGSGSPKHDQGPAHHPQSLLHGILTKPVPSGGGSAPTLAQLLTAPDRERAALPLYGQAKNCGEITITPVQPAAEPQTEKPEEVVQLDDEESPALSESEAADSPAPGGGGGSVGSSGGGAGSGSGSGRLVIDEAAPAPAEDAPLCQGCRRRDAQFVCAGCANQWYCSRDCQVAAWDEHSEMCSG